MAALKCCWLLEFSTFVIIVCLIAAQGFAYPADDNFAANAEPLAYALSGASHEGFASFLRSAGKPKNCFHFYVSRNMSSLLSDATKMLQHVRDRREREWILTFIYRIKSLSEHLRTHPESQNYECLPGADVNPSNSNLQGDPMRPELYFVDDMQTGNNQKRSNGVSPEVATGQGAKQRVEVVDATEQSSRSSTRSEQVKVSSDLQGHSLPSEHIASGKTAASSDNRPSSGSDRNYDNGIVQSSPPDCDSSQECKDALKKHLDSVRQGSVAATVSGDDLLVQDVMPGSYHNHEEEEHTRQNLLKERIRKALLEEMAPEVNKLRNVGGTEQDLIDLWRLAESSTSQPPKHDVDFFDYEEIGAAAGDPNSNEGYTHADHTVAPSASDMKNLKRHSGRSTQPYDDSDVLVQQLFDVRFEQESSKSKNGHQNEYLITSTQNPY